MLGAKRSTIPPRCAYSPGSRTVLERRKPFVASHCVSKSISTTFPGAAEKVSAAILARGGTRWSRQSTVVAITRGCWADDFERASRASAVMRREAIAALGETRS